MDGRRLCPILHFHPSLSAIVEDIHVYRGEFSACWPATRVAFSLEGQKCVNGNVITKTGVTLLFDLEVCPKKALEDRLLNRWLVLLCCRWDRPSWFLGDGGGSGWFSRSNLLGSNFKKRVPNAECVRWSEIAIGTSQGLAATKAWLGRKTTEIFLNYHATFSGDLGALNHLIESTNLVVHLIHQGQVVLLNFTFWSRQIWRLQEHYC